MRHRIGFVSLFACLLALAACGSTPASNAPSTPTPTAATQPTPTNTPSPSLTVYTSPDHKYQISYPIGWQQQTADGNPAKSSFTGPGNQNFEVTDNAGIPGGSPASYVNGYCNAIAMIAGNIQTTTVTIAGQTWTKGNCDAGTNSSTVLIVEVVIYKGAVYQIDYGSSAANEQADDATYYAPMEQSFKFLT
ncbi:MAG TPA: hypothetical protein VKT82_03880 [Ktedonobacterales bacterium]|nr:hypothetical protein [Ktedonobacterales bacterium]